MGQSISSPVPVFAKECTELHKKYDQCFSTWYDKEFLKGESMENPCLDHWTDYMQCVNVALIKKGIRSIDTLDKEDLPDNIGEVLKQHAASQESTSEKNA